jgi:hypothetical protein
VAKIDWEVVVGEQVHTVRLVHGYWSGKREIWVDGELVERGRKIFDSGSRHFFTIGDQEFEAAILTNGVTVNYFLLQEGNPVLSEKEKATGKKAEDLLNTRYLRDTAFWQELAQRLNMSYVSSRNADWVYRHSLIGLQDGYLIVIGSSIDLRGFKPIWVILIRHGAPLSPEGSVSRINEQLESLNYVHDASGSDQDYTSVSLTRADKTETPETLAVRVNEVFGLIKENFPPLPDNLCDDPECPNKLVRERRLVFVNGFPRLLCEQSIRSIGDQAEIARQEFDRLPAHTERSLIMGARAALIMALCWPLINFVNRIPKIGIVLGLLIMIVLAGYLTWIGIYKAMTLIKLRPNGIFWLGLILLSESSVLLGMLLYAVTGKVLEGHPLDAETWQQAWVFIFQENALRASFVGSWMFVGVRTWLGWSSYRDEYRSFSKPKVEILKGVY